VSSIGKALGLIFPDELEPRFMDQRRRLQRVARTFSGELLLRHPVQLGVNNRQQLFLRFCFPLFRCREQSRYFAHLK
jgi:hypothetical protein